MIDPSITPVAMLENNVVLTMEQLAFVAGLLHTRRAKKGQPDERRALGLVRRGILDAVDRTQPTVRLTVPANAVRRYYAGPIH